MCKPVSSGLHRLRLRVEGGLDNITFFLCVCAHLKKMTIDIKFARELPHTSVPLIQHKS